MKFSIHLFTFLITLLGIHSLFSEEVSLYDGGPIHEAYLQPLTSTFTPLDSIAATPPAPIKETAPSQTDSQSSWIPGYWAWVPEKNDFIWVSGVWRRPPPGQQWIPGMWQNLEGGWVYLRGFWTNESNLTYIKQNPPEEIYENATQSPGTNFFWVPGYWSYTDDKYFWVSGEWKQFDSSWVLVPNHYIWRPEGYVFIPSYWDWPLETRGTAYANVLSSKKENLSYEPKVTIDPLMIAYKGIFNYPNYLYFYHHHYFYHPDLWAGDPFVPPWWGWANWWSYNWQDHWAVWWWYTHPGFPQPYWVDAGISKKIPPAPGTLILALRKQYGPSIITPQGIASPESILKAISQITGNRVNPVIPNSVQIKSQIANELKKSEFKPIYVLKPSGDISAATLVRAPKLQGPNPEFKKSQNLFLGINDKIPLLPPEKLRQVPLKPGQIQAQTPLIEYVREITPPPPQMPMIQQPSVSQKELVQQEKERFMKQKWQEQMERHHALKERASRQEIAQQQNVDREKMLKDKWQQQLQKQQQPHTETWENWKQQSHERQQRRSQAN